MSMRGMNRWVVLGAGLLALVCVLFVYDRLSRTAARDAEDDRSTAQSEPALVPSDGSPQAPQPPLEPAAKLEPAGTVQSKPPHAEVARPPMPPSGNFEAMQRAFESQTRDGTWASEQEARIPQLLIEVGFKDDAFDRNATCRSTLCRFSLIVSEDDAADMFALMKLSAQVQTSEGVGLSYGAAEAAGQKSRIVVFLARDGISLKDLQEN